MSEKHDDGGPAFVIPAGGALADGMTLLDWFANGFRSDAMHCAVNSMDDEEQQSFPQLAATASKYCYEFSAAMIAEKRRRERGAT